MSIVLDKIQILKIHWFVDQLSWSTKSIPSLPKTTALFSVCSNRPLILDKQGLGLQNTLRSIAVP